MTHSCHPRQIKKSRSDLATYQVWDQSGLHETMSQNQIKLVILLMMNALEYFVASFGSWVKAVFPDFQE